MAGCLVEFFSLTDSNRLSYLGLPVNVKRSPIVRYTVTMAMKKETNPLSPEEVSRLGEQFYFDQLKEKLEKKHTGKYVVIDVTRKMYALNADELTAIEEARKRFGDQLFFIVRVGNLQRPVAHFRNAHYAWKL